MPVNIIDTLKPKNGLNFPVVEAIDVFVEDYENLADAISHFATDVMIEAINAVLSDKANTSDVNTAVANLQGQINQIVISASAEAVVAPEVAQARVGNNGTEFNTLKDRLDNTDTNLEEFKGNVFNTDNLLLNSTIVENAYYTGGTETSSDNYSYAIVPMLASKTYIISQARFVAYRTGAAVEEYVTNAEFTPSADGNVYISFYHNIESKGEWAVYEKGKDPSKIGTYQHPALSEGILAKETGSNDNIAISQKAVTDALNALDTKPVPIAKISGITIKDGTDLSPEFVEEGDGGYTASGVGGTISRITYENYKYFKLPVNGAATYYIDDGCRWWFTTDDNNTVVDCSTGAVNISLPISATAKMLWVTYSTASPNPSTRAIGKNKFPVTDTLYLLPDEVEDSHLDELGNIQGFFNQINLFDSANLISNKYYYNGSYIDNDLYSVLIFNVESGKTYQFGCPIRFLDKQSVNISSNLPAKSTYTADYSGLIYCSVQSARSADWKVVELPNDVDTVNSRGVPSINPDMIAQGIGSSKSLLMSQYGATQAILTNPKLYGKGYATIKGDLSEGESLTLPRTNIKKNNVYSFMAYVTTFDTLLIGHGKNTYDGSWIEINDTNVIVHTFTTYDSPITYAHNLTISDYIYIQITVGVGTANISVYSNGEEYTLSDIGWLGDGNGNTFAESDGSTLTDCVFTWSSADFRKSIWMFGDSYFSMTSTSRWVKYLINAGYGDKVLLNAYPGEATSAATIALDNAIEYYGIPNFIVWCLGMNDGTDANEDTPSASWLSGVNHVLDICQANGITPIFATIPTVPEINHEGKNKYIRNSEYRYIDFAKAVGADGSGEWFDGMLNNDNVHPNVSGAIALYHRAIADCPEITYSNP